MHASDCLGAFCHTYWDWREGWPFPSLLMFAAGCGALDSQSLSSVTRPYCARSSSLAVPACACAARKGGEVCEPSVVALRFLCSWYPTATEPRTTVRSSKPTAPVSPPSPSSPLQPPRAHGSSETDEARRTQRMTTTRHSVTHVEATKFGLAASHASHCSLHLDLTH